MSHGADRWQTQLAGQVHVAGSRQVVRNLTVEDIQYPFLPLAVEAAAGAEVDNPQSVQLAALLQQCDLFEKAPLSRIIIGPGVGGSGMDLVDDRQAVDFKEGDLQQGTVQAQLDVLAVRAQREVVHLETHRGQIVQEIRFEIAQGCQVANFVVLKA